jgi:hypothetical protein
MDWHREIAIARMVQAKVSEADKRQLWSYHNPEARASDESIDAIEKTLGYPLPTPLKEFYRVANGWKCVYQNIHLFGVEELVSGPKLRRANGLLDNIHNIRIVSGFDRNELLPIAVSLDDSDVFVISKAFVRESGVVVWFAKDVIDRFPNFSEWFLSMVDYNRLEYQELIRGGAN